MAHSRGRYGLDWEKLGKAFLPFRPDNCTGYTAVEMKKLNREFADRMQRGEYHEYRYAEAMKRFRDEVAGR